MAAVRAERGSPRATDLPTLQSIAGRAAADLGVGIRFVAKDFLAVNVALVNTTYVDQPNGTSKGGAQNMMAIYAGFSLFIPFKSTYRESE